MDTHNLALRTLLYDTTLRDGAQMRGISHAVGDKLKITRLLDEFGIHYIEGGWPGSNPKDEEYFKEAKKLRLQRAKLVAFGSTRRKSIVAKDDSNLGSLLRAETPVVTIFGKCWLLHVREILGVSPEENLSMISESVHFLKDHGREVVFDAEHFFDGYKDDPEFALQALKAACDGGADWLVLCDTNGGVLPDEISKVVQDVTQSVITVHRTANPHLGLGIHTHNDAEMAVANSLCAMRAGCEMVQGTLNGYGERCGNANLISIIPSLQLKMTRPCVAPAKLRSLTELSHKVSEVVNLSPNSKAAYVGVDAFTHKAGVHVSAVEKVSRSYEHVSPEVVGNKRSILVSELSGRGNLRALAERCGLNADGQEAQWLSTLKDLEARGFHFENSEESLELRFRRSLPGYVRPFRIIEVMVVSRTSLEGISESQATVRLMVGNTKIHTAAEGTGPVEALDIALRKALEPHFPALSEVRLMDFKVRIFDPSKGSSANTRVHVEAGYGGRRWNTVGCSPNLIEASLQALCDSFEHFLISSCGVGREYSTAV